MEHTLGHAGVRRFPSLASGNLERPGLTVSHGSPGATEHWEMMARTGGGKGVQALERKSADISRLEKLGVGERR